MKFKEYVKPRLQDLYKLLTEVVIFFIGLFLFIPLIGIGLIYSVVKHLIKMDFSLSKYLKPIVRSATLVTSGFANASAGELLNDLSKISKSEKIKYGKWYQTIPAVAGLRLMFVKDTNFRKILDKILGKNHCIDAVNESDRFYHNYK